MGKISEELTYGLTIRESATDGSDFTNPAADYRRLFLGEDGQLHVRDSAGAVTGIGAGGSVATDAIWDAAGDLAVGSGANTAAKLTAGSEGQVLTIVSAVPAWAAASGGGLSSFETYLTGLSGLVHRWKFEEASGNFVDGVGSLDLVASGAFTYDVAGGPVSGAAGSVTFGASGKGVSSGLGSIPTGGSARTFVLVFKGKQSASKQCLYSYGAASSLAWWTTFLNDGAADAHSLAIYADDMVVGSLPGNDASWHLHVVTCDGDSTGTNTLWMDGRASARRINAGAVNTTAGGNFTIGQDTGGGNQLGTVTYDDLAVFSRALAPWEIMGLLMRLGT